METVKDYSFGVIPVIQEAGEWKVFVLHQISYRHNADRYWTFPKGHPENNETPEETARRELTEESNIMLERLDTSRTFDQAYTFVHNDTNIEKTVSYFVGYARTTEFAVQPDEVLEGRWCTFAQARQQLSHEIAKNILDEVQVYVLHN